MKKAVAYEEYEDKQAILEVIGSLCKKPKLRLDYNIGPSSWLHSHVIIHKNGKAQHINISKNGTYTTIKD